MAAVPSARKAIVYLHGFISSPRSRKATMLGDYVANCVSGIDYVVPELHHRPARAIEQAHAACAGRAAADLTLVGSSLGGFYATVMAQRLGCRAALLNPAVHPQRHFGRYLGRQRNLYTGEEFELTVEHVDELLSLDPPAITRPERYWLLVETGDEVLDYREAVEYYRGACQSVVRGGDHTLTSFPEFVPDLVDWAAS
ncbi:MAG TPA: YqiA/YcfP family alpha/beta fold hydrolase [Usitatibacter sp.]|nr:YqiA/YcfP family alpha/beta fold hydrolase [Usitatibacter sp.]